MRYHFQAVVERKVLDTISVAVDTSLGVKDALRKAKKALASYPSPVDVEGVKTIYTENRDNVESTLTSIERMIPTDD